MVLWDMKSGVCAVGLPEDVQDWSDELLIALAVRRKISLIGQASLAAAHAPRHCAAARRAPIRVWRRR